jgi:hypothetical protein
MKKTNTIKIYFDIDTDTDHQLKLLADKFSNPISRKSLLEMLLKRALQEGVGDKIISSTFLR